MSNMLSGVLENHLVAIEGRLAAEEATSPALKEKNWTLPSGDALRVLRGHVEIKRQSDNRWLTLARNKEDVRALVGVLAFECI